MAKEISKYALLQSELGIYKKIMQLAADRILEEIVSEYPIFVVHQQQLEIGIPLVIRGETRGNWSINASTLEEFLAKNLIDEIKVDSFRTIYKNPAKNLCLFVLSELGAEFIFLPREDI